MNYLQGIKNCGSDVFHLNIIHSVNVFPVIQMYVKRMKSVTCPKWEMLMSLIWISLDTGNWTYGIWNSEMVPSSNYPDRYLHFCCFDSYILTNVFPGSLIIIFCNPWRESLRWFKNGFFLFFLFNLHPNYTLPIQLKTIQWVEWKESVQCQDD